MRIRPERVAERIKREAADILENNLRDPRIGSLVSVTDVEITNDLSVASIFVSILAEGEPRDRTLAALQRAAGFVRHELAPRLGLREVPEIRFRLDTSVEQGARVDALLRKLAAGEPIVDDDTAS